MRKGFCKLKSKLQLSDIGVILCLLIFISLCGCEETTAHSTTDIELSPSVWIVEPFRVISQSDAHPDSYGNQEKDEFGSSIATGDFNCDEIPDIAIGAPYDSFGSGGVAIFFGEPDSTNFQYGPWIDKEVYTVAYSRFGYSLASGDFDYDGCDDLAIGAPTDDGLPGGGPVSGWVYVKFGDPVSPLERSQDFGQYGSGADQENDWFGATLAVGDFDGDSYDDLAVGAVGDREEGLAASGYVHVRHGYSGGINLDPQLAYGFGVNPISAPCENQNFGWAMTAGNFNGDWRPSIDGIAWISDLAVSAPNCTDGRANRVYIRPGSREGMRAPEGYYFVESAAPVPMDYFGIALTSCDIQNDGGDDLIVSNWTGTAHIEIFDGGWYEFPSPLSVESFTGPDAEGCPPWETAHWGAALECADFDGDSLYDIALGAPQDEGHTPHNAGYVAIRYGAPENADYPTREAGYACMGQEPAEISEPHDNAGSSLAAIDILNNGIADLVFGVPGEHFEGVSDTGIAVLTQPIPRYDTPWTGVYTDTNYENQDLKAVFLQTETNQIYASLLVTDGTFWMFFHDCCDDEEYAEQFEEWDTGEYMMSGGPWDLDHREDNEWQGSFGVSRLVRDGDFTLYSVAHFTAHGDDLIDGHFNTVNVEINSVTWELTRTESGNIWATGSCPTFDPASFSFTRVPD